MAWQRDRSANRKKGFGRGRGEDFGDFGAPAPRPAFEPVAPTPTQPRVRTVVKWFNATKGFGFVSPEDESGDAFLHISALERAGFGEVTAGTTIVCDLVAGQRGPQVGTVHEVDTSTAEPPRQPRRDGDRPVGEPIEGTVKFFSTEKGFGFVAPDGGGKDVFVHIKTLERSGLSGLDIAQRVRMTVSMGQKGPQAESLVLL